MLKNRLGFQLKHHKTISTQSKTHLTFSEKLTWNKNKLHIVILGYNFPYNNKSVKMKPMFFFWKKHHNIV